MWFDLIQRSDFLDCSKLSRTDDKDGGFKTLFSLKYCFIKNMRMSGFLVIYISFLFECLKLIFMGNSSSGPLNLKYVID